MNGVGAGRMSDGTIGREAAPAAALKGEGA